MQRGARFRSDYSKSKIKKVWGYKWVHYKTDTESYTELSTASTTGIDATTLDTVEDGNATSTALQLSGAAVKSTGTLTSAGNLDVNTDKFTVDATTGNSTVAGTLGVSGQITGNVTGDLTGEV